MKGGGAECQECGAAIPALQWLKYPGGNWCRDVCRAATFARWRGDDDRAEGVPEIVPGRVYPANWERRQANIGFINKPY